MLTTPVRDVHRYVLQVLAQARAIDITVAGKLQQKRTVMAAMCHLEGPIP